MWSVMEKSTQDIILGTFRCLVEGKESAKQMEKEQVGKRKIR